jgi:hypothetical protein
VGTEEEHVAYATPPPDAYDIVDADHDDDALVRVHALADVGVSCTPLDLADQEVEGERLLFTSVEEPTTFREAADQRCWQQAMQEERSSIEENGTWTLVDLPAGFRPIGLTWVYKVKRNERGVIVKHKARLVAKGYVQRTRIEFEEVYAPVARLESVR